MADSTNTVDSGISAANAPVGSVAQGVGSPQSTPVAPNTAPLPGLINAPSGTTTQPSVQQTQGQAASSPVVNADATIASAHGYTAVPFTVNPEDTVSGQLKNVISQNSPLIQQAVTNAAQTANARGLLNSSIAAGAEEGAVINSALPIAQQDAQTYAQAMTNTGNAQNTALSSTAQAANAASATNAQLQTGVSQSNAAASNQQTLQQIQSNTSLTGQQMVDQTNQAVAQINTDTQKQVAQLQASTSLTSEQMQTQSQQLITQMGNATQQAIAGIQSNTQLTVADKQAAVQTLTTQLQTQTQIATANINAASSLKNIDENGQIQKQIADIQANYNTLIQTTSSATSLYTTSLNSLTTIAQDPNITDKRGAMNNAMATLNDGLGLIGDIQGLNLGTNLNFGTTPGTTSLNPAPVAPAATNGGMDGLLGRVFTAAEGGGGAG